MQVVPACLLMHVPERRVLYHSGNFKFQESIMKRHFSMGLAMLASAAFGAIAVNGPHAQNKAPGAYVVIDISAINNPEMFKTLLPKIAPSNAAFGGQNI